MAVQTSALANNWIAFGSFLESFHSKLRPVQAQARDPRKAGKRVMPATCDFLHYATKKPRNHDLRLEARMGGPVATCRSCHRQTQVHGLNVPLCLCTSVSAQHGRGVAVLLWRCEELARSKGDRLLCPVPRDAERCRERPREAERGRERQVCGEFPFAFFSIPRSPLRSSRG